MAPGSQLTHAQRSRAQRSALLAQMFAIMIGSVVGGEYMMLYANDVLGLSPASIAAIISLAPFASVLRIPALPYIQRIGLTRSLQVARAGQGLIVLILLLLPAVAVTFPVLAILVVVFVLFRELGLGTVWQPLMRHITTDEDRGSFFARMRSSFTLVNLALSGSIAVLVGRQLEEGQYKLLLGLALFGSINAIYWSRGIPEPPVEPGQKRVGFRESLENLWRLFRTSSLFRLPLAITLIITASQIPIGIIYFREVLHIPANLLGAQIFCATLGQVLSLMLWGRVSDTLGFRPMLAGLLWLTTGLSLLLWIIPAFPVQDWTWGSLWSEMPMPVSALLLFGFGNGVLNAGLGIATTSVMHYHVNNRDSLIAMNLFALIQLCFQSAIVFALGLYLQHIVIPGVGQGSPLEWFHFDFYKVYRSAVVPALMLFAIPLVLKLPNLKPWFGVGDFFLVMRHNPWRSLLGTRRIYNDEEAGRVQLARDLGESPNPLNLPPLAELLQDPAFEVKIEAIRSLARSGSPFAGEQLQAILADEERRSLWDHAAWGLGELRHEAALELLITRLDPSSPVRVRAMAARALGKLRRPEAVEPLLTTIQEEDNPLHVVSACCWGLLHLEAYDRADIALQALLRLREREERYEILSIFSRWLGFTDRWILVADSRSSAWESLREYLDTMPDRWIATRKETIDAFLQRDFAGIRVIYRERLAITPESTEERPVLQALGNILEGQSEWSPAFVLATAWLLLGPEPEPLS